MPDTASKVSCFITESAQPKSQKNCAKFVREAIQKALDKPIQGAGIASAKDFGTWLEKNGYQGSTKKVDEAKVGDVAIFPAIENHKHGHIQIKCDDGKWRSDFEQKSFIPFNSAKDYTIFELKK